MSNNFRIGQKVVCVDDSPDWGCLSGVKRGCVYTVSAKGGVHGTGVQLREVSAHCCEIHSGFFKSTRFRPAVNKPASIEVFRRMLVPSDEGVNA